MSIAKKMTLVEDTLQTLEELLKYADELERLSSARSKRKQTAEAPSSPAKKKQRVTVSRLGSPTRHKPVTFHKAGKCMVVSRAGDDGLQPSSVRPHAQG